MKLSSHTFIIFGCLTHVLSFMQPIMSPSLKDASFHRHAVNPVDEFSAESLSIFTSKKQESDANLSKSRNFAISAAALFPFVFTVQSAVAKGGELGIWEGRSFALLHPIIMGTLFALSGYSALLGLRWRELRTMGTAVSRIKEQLPLLSSGEKANFPLSKEIDSINSNIASLDASDITVSNLKADLEKLSTASKLEEEYNSLVERRKELSSQNVREKHYELGSIILGLGVFAAIEGPVNTYIRAGKLFPGPHLYSGAGIVVAWAIAASLVQQMQKGNEYARLAHIAINFGILGFFAWQVNTGLQITEKVLQFTKWP